MTVSQKGTNSWASIWKTIHGQLIRVCTANEGPARIQYKCLVPIHVFPEMKPCSLVISKTELLCSFSQFLHSCICDRFIYSQDQSAYLATAKYLDRSCEYINSSEPHECRNWDRGRAIPFLGIHTVNGIFVAVWLLHGFHPWTIGHIVWYTLSSTSSITYTCIVNTLD
jgi:hypothetical protein